MSDTLCIPLSIDGDQSLLPERVCQILNSGIWKGFEDGFLDLGLKYDFVYFLMQGCYI